MLADERLKALVCGSLPINKEEELWLKEYKNVDFERFGLLLDGKDEPRDFKEKMWLENYLKNSKASINESLKKSKKYQEISIKANKELYILLKSSFPSDFFCKNPVSKEDFIKVYDKCTSKAELKYKFIRKNPFLSKKYHLEPLHWGPDVQSGYWISIFLKEYLGKVYKVDIKSLEVLYQKYITSEFIEKAENIESKYNTVLFPYHKFDFELWITDYGSYK